MLPDESEGLKGKGGEAVHGKGKESEERSSEVSTSFGVAVFLYFEEVQKKTWEEVASWVSTSFF